jgi:hypothetical protein
MCDTWFYVKGHGHRWKQMGKVEGRVICVPRHTGNLDDRANRANLDD